MTSVLISETVAGRRSQRQVFQQCAAHGLSYKVSAYKNCHGLTLYTSPIWMGRRRDAPGAGNRPAPGVRYRIIVTPRRNPR